VSEIQNNYLSKEESQEISPVISDLFENLESRFPVTSFKLNPPNREKATVFGWVNLPSEFPEESYIEIITSTVEILAKNYQRHQPRGFFELDNNIGDSAFSFRVYYNEE
jgi:hypothetical protein